jgi:predicted Rossmann-fold nucleotide-binding protein
MVDQKRSSPATAARVRKSKTRRRRSKVSPAEQAEDTSFYRARRRHIDERLQILYKRTSLLEDELKLLEDNRFYRVCIFGSARTKPDTPEYNRVFTLARYLAWENIDILSGGGPGLMEAANAGAQLGQQEKHTKSFSYGLPIRLDFEPRPNKHLDVKRQHLKFSSRLDDFMRLSHAIVCTPGGIGTLLELFFSWQLIQVHHIALRPLVLMDRDYWTGIVDWMRKVPLSRGLISPQDFSFVSIVDSPEEVMQIISEHHQRFRQEKQGR